MFFFIIYIYIYIYYMDTRPAWCKFIVFLAFLSLLVEINVKCTKNVFKTPVLFYIDFLCTIFMKSKTW